MVYFYDVIDIDMVTFLVFKTIFNFIFKLIRKEMIDNNIISVLSD